MFWTSHTIICTIFHTPLHYIRKLYFMVFHKLSTMSYNHFLGNPLKEPFASLKTSSELIDFMNSALKGTAEMNRQIKIFLLGNGGVGKSSLVSACQRNEVNLPSLRAPFGSVDSTVGISVYDSNALVLGTKVQYQLWDFAGQLEYATIHQVCSGLSHEFCHL